MSRATRFVVRPAEPGGWVAWWHRDGGDSDEAGEILGAGETVEAAVQHVRERQARGLAPTPEEAVVRPHSAALGIRLLLDDRDAAVLGRSASAGRGRCVSWAAPREGDHIT
jgi:hypothetical protein